MAHMKTSSATSSSHDLLLTFSVLPSAPPEFASSAAAASTVQPYTTADVAYTALVEWVEDQRDNGRHVRTAHKRASSVDSQSTTGSRCDSDTSVETHYLPNHGGDRSSPPDNDPPALTRGNLSKLQCSLGMEKESEYVNNVVGGAPSAVAVGDTEEKLALII